MSKLEHTIFCSFLMLLFAAAVIAQDTKAGENDEVIRVETDLVDVPVAVTDAKGIPIKTLKASNFVVYEDGVRQAVTEFTASSAPFEVALLLDTSGSARNDLPLIRRAAEVFISSLRAGDRVAIIAFDMANDAGVLSPRVDILSPLTADRTALGSALARLRTSAGTPYYDGLAEIGERVFANTDAGEFRGRRAIVALTDAVDSTSTVNFAEAREKLEAKGLISYFVRVDTREYFEENLLGDCEAAMRFSTAQIRRYYRTLKGNPSMEKASVFCQLGDFERLAVSKKLYEIADSEMEDLAKRSGGRVFQTSDLADARRAFQAVAADLGTRFTLGYYPTNEKRDGKYRRITVELKGLSAGSKVRARAGYTARTN
ncbi:MAG: von Willebrand factor type A domain-containing protein [Acidobacteria bacterium OLB17]|nr:MAG: von Willebrand factor type A domain-containing protein [Acidobacteria bacterium OLB17]MCZ2391762.1 VWA domain-containing protein [Acidobacteriota bacterium]